MSDATNAESAKAQQRRPLFLFDPGSVEGRARDELPIARFVDVTADDAVVSGGPEDRGVGEGGLGAFEAAVLDDVVAAGQTLHAVLKVGLLEFGEAGFELLLGQQRAGPGFGDAVLRAGPGGAPQRDGENLVAVAQLDVPLASSSLPGSRRNQRTSSGYPAWSHESQSGGAACTCQAVCSWLTVCAEPPQALPQQQLPARYMPVENSADGPPRLLAGAEIRIC